MNVSTRTFWFDQPDRPMVRVFLEGVDVSREAVLVVAPEPPGEEALGIVVLRVYDSYAHVVACSCCGSAATLTRTGRVRWEDARRGASSFASEPSWRIVPEPPAAERASEEWVEMPARRKTLEESSSPVPPPTDSNAPDSEDVKRWREEHPTNEPVSGTYVQEGDET